MTDEPLGSKANPLTITDLPFTVPRTGRYWLKYGEQLIHLPESPEGSVLAFDLKPIIQLEGEEPS